jgi:hypothetical protein
LKFDGDKAVEVEVNGEVQPGKVATLSDAVIPIEAGEIIGYTTRKAGDQASNYFHWEVFSAEDNLFEDLAKKCGIEGFDFSVLDLAGKDGVLGKDEAASLLGVQEITSYQGQWRVGGTAFRDYLADNFVRKPGTYAFSLVCRPPGNIRIRRGLTAGISAWCGKRKLKISVSDNQITITEPDKSGEGNTVLESFSSLCEKEYSVIGCKTLDRLSIEPPGGLTLDYYAEEGRELFVEQASIPGLFRNYSLSTS